MGLRWNKTFEDLCREIYDDCYTAFPCPSVYRCSFEFPSLNVFSVQTGLPTIIVVLESPHKSEFYQDDDPLKRKGIAPAQGSSGWPIERYLPKMIQDAFAQNSLSLPAQVNVFLLEAVSYQCSNNLDSIDYECRDNLFRDVWTSFGKRNFKRRLNVLKKINPIAIINACTGKMKSLQSYGNRLQNSRNSSSKPKYMNALNVLVQQSIDAVFGSVASTKRFYTMHPSSFSRHKKRNMALWQY